MGPLGSFSLSSPGHCSSNLSVLDNVGNRLMSGTAPGCALRASQDSILDNANCGVQGVRAGVPSSGKKHRNGQHL